MISHPKILAISQILLSSICFGFLGIFGNLLFASGRSTGEILSFRFFFATILLGAGLLLFRRSLFRINFRMLVVCAFLGAFGYAVFATCFFQAVKGASLPLAALLLYTYPLWVFVIEAILFRRKIEGKEWVAIAIAGFSMYFVLGGEIILKEAAALVWGLASGFTYGVYVVVSGKIQRSISTWTSNFYIILFASLALFFGHSVSFEKVFEFSVQDLVWILSLSLVCTVVPMVLFLSGLQKLKTSQASLLSIAEPVAATLLSVLILGQNLNFANIAGILGVIAAIVLAIV